MLWLALFVAVSDSIRYSGLKQELRVSPPRFEEEIRVDGALTEPVWQHAARLVGFSQYSPVDGRPSEQETEVLVWYSPSAIHFGVRANAAPGTVRAHLGDRDKGIIPDDYIEIQLGTFNDRRQAFVFAANPLGVQADGALNEGTSQQNPGAQTTTVAGREQADLSPDYAWDSKGRLTDFGYEIEIRIPFKSLRFQRADPQDWALHVIRKSAAAGREDTWAPTLRAATSFLAQAGTLTGLTGIHQGTVLELNPVVTSSVAGGRLPSGAWDYSGGSPEFGGNVRWGVTTDATLNATVKPDFSQVEADASQFSPDPRNLVYFQEKRPFFLDGIQYFATPSQLIYTRRILAPVAAAKLTGKSHGWSFGFISAVDDKIGGVSGSNPIYNLLRVQRDLGSQSRVGFGYTDRIDGRFYNRVGQVDGRYVFGGVYSLSAIAALALTRDAARTSTAPSWSVSFARNGRQLGWSATARGIDPDFQEGSGFVSRGNIAQLNFRPSLTGFGGRGAFLERYTLSVNMDLLWNYHDLFDGRRSLERKLHPTLLWTLRGGWSFSVALLLESFAADPSLYAGYALAVPRAGGGIDTIPYFGPRLKDLPNTDLSFNFNSPQVHGVELDGFLIYGKDENFFEWSNATIWYGNLTAAIRPTPRLRFDGTLALRNYERKTDGSTVGATWIPRLKIEYQVSRPVFLRLVGEYASDRHGDLRDDSRTNAPILIRDPTDGIYKRELALASQTNTFRVDWLFSYQPTPGTVFFAGYGSTLAEDRAFAFSRLSRQRDGFFTKLSYNFRL